MSARLSGRAKGTSGSVSITVNRHEELSDRSAPYADFGHGSLFEAAPGARQFGRTAESPTKFLMKPFNIRMYGGWANENVKFGRDGTLLAHVGAASRPFRSVERTCVRIPS